MKTPRWVHESNLIEGVRDPAADAVCWDAYLWFLGQPMGTDAILELHKRVMDGRLPPQYVGAWRTVDVTVGGRSCPPFEHVPALMADWFHRFAGASSAAQAIIAHVAFERVHPFVDGNGRIGRMVMNWQRQKAYLKPLTIAYADRWEYYGWFV